MTEPVFKPPVWTKERDEALRVMVASKMITKSIAEALELTQSMVARRITFLKLREEPETTAHPMRPNHLDDYKAARRGFVVPEHLERDYHELLKTGIPIAEVCQRLGISTKPENRGE